MNWQHPSTNIWTSGEYQIKCFRHPHIRQKNRFKSFWGNTSIDKTGNPNTLIQAIKRCEEHLALRLQFAPASVATEIPEHSSVA